MPNAHDDSAAPERPSGAEGAERGALEISPEALELLRSAAIPTEFLKIARDFTPHTEVLSPIVPQGSPTSAEIGEPYIEIPMPGTLAEPELEMPMEPWTEELPEPEYEKPMEPVWKEVLWTKPEKPPRPPEDIRREGGAATFFLTDLKLDLKAAPHVTRGLHDLAHFPLAPLVCNQLAFCSGGPRAEDGNRENGEIAQDEEQRDGCKVCRLVVLIGGMNSDGVIRDAAIKGARDWAARRAVEWQGGTGCFQLWKAPSAEARFGRLIVQDISGGSTARDQLQYTPRGGQVTRSFSQLFPELTGGRGRIDELVIFHHGSQVKREDQVILSLGNILVTILSIPVCRLVYWACDAAVELDASPASATDFLMRAFAKLSQEQRCGCKKLVELIKPTAGKCAIKDPSKLADLATGDGRVTRIRWGYLEEGEPPRQLQPDPDPNDKHPFLNPQPSEPETVRDERIMGVPVAEDPTLLPK